MKMVAMAEGKQSSIGQMMITFSPKVGRALQIFILFCIFGHLIWTFNLIVSCFYRCLADAFFPQDQNDDTNP